MSEFLESLTAPELDRMINSAIAKLEGKAGHAQIGHDELYSEALVYLVEFFTEVPAPEARCQVCGGSMVGKRPQARFCTPKCANTAKSRKRRGSTLARESTEQPPGRIGKAYRSDWPTDRRELMRYCSNELHWNLWNFLSRSRLETSMTHEELEVVADS